MSENNRILKIGDVLLPMAVHYVISNLLYVLLGQRVDSALLTTFAAILTFPVLFFWYRRDKSGKNREESKIPWWVYPLAAVVGIAANQLITWTMDYFFVTQRFSNAVQEELFLGNFWVQLVGLGILVPIVEELIFRGLVYQRLKKYVPLWGAILGGAALFALYHGNMVQIIFAFPMAILILLFYERWESLAVPVIFHIAANVSSIILNQFG